MALRATTKPAGDESACADLNPSFAGWRESCAFANVKPPSSTLAGHHRLAGHENGSASCDFASQSSSLRSSGNPTPSARANSSADTKRLLRRPRKWGRRCVVSARVISLLPFHHAPKCRPASRCSARGLAAASQFASLTQPDDFVAGASRSGNKPTYPIIET